MAGVKADLVLRGGHGSFSERHKGTLEPGKLADIAVLERDIFTAPPDEVFETRTDLTILGGAVVYDRQDETELN